MPKLFDIHSHINFNAFKDDGDKVIKRTLKTGVWTILVGSQYDTSKRAVEYAEKYEKGVYASVGLHPYHLTEQDIDISEEDLVGGDGKNFKKSVKSRTEKFDPIRYIRLITPK